MTTREKIEELLEASKDGTISTSQVTEAGLHRGILQEYVKSGEMYRFGRGLYVLSNVWEDDFYLLQRKYGRGIYSHDTALYLLGYSERTLCDILRGSGSDIQIVSEAMKRYAASKDKNIHKLMKYADQLRVKPKVLRYMEVLL